MPATRTHKDTTKDIQVFTGRVVPLMLSRDHDNIELRLSTGIFEAAWFRATDTTFMLELSVDQARSSLELTVPAGEDGRDSLTSALTDAVNALIS